MRPKSIIAFILVVIKTRIITCHNIIISKENKEAKYRRLVLLLFLQ